MQTEKKIDQVHQYIEYCIIHHMTKSETIDCLFTKANIHPTYTESVWKMLEEENEEFMRAYHIRMKMINQIILFNGLLSVQAELMREINGNNGLLRGPDLLSVQAGLMREINGSNGLLHGPDGSMHHSNISQ